MQSEIDVPKTLFPEPEEAAQYTKLWTREQSQEKVDLYIQMFLNFIHQFRRANVSVDPILETEQARQAPEEAAREREEERAQEKNEKQVKRTPGRQFRKKPGKKTDNSLRQQFPSNTVSVKTKLRLMIHLFNLVSSDHQYCQY